MQRLLVVAAAGGLGSAVVREALSRNHSVSVLVRSHDKLREVLGDDALRLAAVHVGSGSDASAVAAAVQGVSAVVSCAPADASIAHTLAQACKESGAKIMWTAGACAGGAASGGTSAPFRLTTAAAEPAPPLRPPLSRAPKADRTCTRRTARHTTTRRSARRARASSQRTRRASKR
jgi:uncharacterized protein YbjT (DUF2867 family)